MLEVLVGLDVQDDDAYDLYRKHMKPLLHGVGGRFRYDFRIADALLSEVESEINRLFIICFPGRNEKEEFFSDPKYLEIKKEYFEGAVNSTTIISEYEVG